MEIQRFGKGCNSRLNPFVIQPNITSMKKTTLDYNYVNHYFSKKESTSDPFNLIDNFSLLNTYAFDRFNKRIRFSVDGI